MKPTQIRAVLTEEYTKAIYVYNGQRYTIEFNRAMNMNTLRRHIAKDIKNIHKGIKKPLSWTEVERFIIDG